MPRAWIKKGINREVPSKKSENLNVCGLYSRDNQFISYTFTGKIDSEILTRIFNNFVQEINSSKISYIVLDNAPTHRSGFFQKNILEWETQFNVKFFFLPTYSPELNLIEILWKRIKHSWLPFKAFESFITLKNHLNFIIANIGKKYIITFA